MFLFYALVSCFLYNSKFKLSRRPNDIYFTDNSNKAIRSNDDSWYFVKFNFQPSKEDQIVSDLQSKGINLKSTNYISKNLFNLYLTPSQVNYITSKGYGQVHEIEESNKLLSAPPKKWSFLTIESSNSDELIREYQRFLSNDKCKYTFTKMTDTIFSVKGSQACLTSLIPTLVQNKKLYAISYDHEAETLNCRATGFTQLNADKATVSIDETDGRNIVEVDRFLNKQGIDGTGINVLVVDTFLDTNSTFFYDPNHPNVELNQVVKGHRKIDYISVLDTAVMVNNDHGTHTAGSITGRALNDTTSAAKYNGCAPNSRLSFYSSTYRDFIPDEINKVSDISQPQVSTNSWGLLYENPKERPPHDAIWDQISFEKDKTLYVFSAGNDAVSGSFDMTEGYNSLRSPGSAKNVLTVGSVQSVHVNETLIGNDKREIYMTDEEDESTRLTKILKWSISGGDSKNPGFKWLFESGRLKVSILRNPRQITNTTVVVIDSEEEFYQLSKEKTPYFVITTVEFECTNFSQLGFTHEFPVLYLDKSYIPKYESNILESNYRTSSGYIRAEFSSKGVGNLGIMKPDIMSPGVSVVSARAVVGGSYDQKELTIKHGTSMATPISAGAAALVYQYFKDGKYRKVPMEISSSLARSFLITCSDPLTTVYPNPSEGFGLLNLGKCIGNGDEVDNKRLLVSDRLKITSDDGTSTHQMANFTVKVNEGEKIDLRVTLSYLDLVLSADSVSALAIDIDLVVVSPSGVVYRGNMRPDNTEERYMTNERVIVDSEKVESGDYEIHVFSTIPNDLKSMSDKVNFAITIFGPLDNDKNGNSLKFVKADKCIPTADLAFNECNMETLDNKCSFNYYGRSCQIEAQGFSGDMLRAIVKVQPYGLKYVTFYYPSMRVASTTFRVAPATMFDPKIFAFYDPDKVKVGGSEGEADEISNSNGFKTTFVYDPNNLPSSEIYALIVIYNTSPHPTDFVITTESVEYTEPPTAGESEPVSEPPLETETKTVTETQTITKTVTETQTKQPVTETATKTVTHTATETVTAPSSSSSSSSESNESDDDSNSKLKSISIAATVIACFFAAMSIGLIVLLFLIVFRRKTKNDKSDSTLSIQNPLLT